FAQRLVAGDEAVRRRRILQRHHAVDQHFHLTGSCRAQTALEVSAILGPESADDAETLLIEPPDVQRDEAAAVSARGHEPAAGREAVERAVPQGWIGDVLED